MYYRNAQSALVVYDLTKPASLTKAKRWVEELQRQASPGIVIALVGNKLDLCDETPASSGGAGAVGPNDATDDDDDDDEDGEGNETAVGSGNGGDARKISTAEAKTYADEEGLLFFETSAKTGTNVTEVFTAIANAIPESTFKGGRGGAGAAGGGAAGGGLAGRGANGDQSRVNLSGGLGDRAGAKEGCAC